MTTKKPNIVEVTDGVEIIREMTDDEYAQHLKDLEAAKVRNEAEADKVAAKQSAQAKLAALGLTADEVVAIIGD
jgi:hypothetical protein